MRSCEAVSLPNEIVGCAQPRPDRGDNLSSVQGGKKRLLNSRPVLNKLRLERLSEFVKKWLQENLVPLEREDITSPDEWIETCNQPESRRKEYREALAAYRDGGVPYHKVREIKTFTKGESYPEYKYPRLINARSDYAKVLIGPFFKAIEKKLFSLPWYIKKIPRAQWPTYIRDRCGRLGVKCIATDYSSFESSFTPEVMEHLEMVLYEYMMGKCASEFEVEFVRDLMGINKLSSAGFSMKCVGRRMSGEMNTSLGNGFSNLMLMLFVLFELGCTDISGVVEGDDGLFVFNGPVPSSADFRSLGMEIKLDEHRNYNEASFCGVVFAEGVGDNLMNPLTVLCNQTWVSRDYATATDRTLRSLQIVKALSTLAQLPGCPIVQEVAKWQLRTAGYEPKEKNQILKWALSQRNTGWWTRKVLEDVEASTLDPRPVDYRSRLLVESKYGFSVEAQLQLESLFENSDGNVDLRPWYSFPTQIFL